MECPHCNKPIQLLRRVYLNLEIYKPSEGSVVSKTQCCGQLVTVHKNTRFSYSTAEDVVEDDWGATPDSIKQV